MTFDEDEMNMIDEYGGSDSDSENEVTEPTKTAIYMRDALHDKLQDISWPEDVDWSHKLTVQIDQGQAVDVNDDVARETAFYTQALQGTRQAFEKLQEMDFPFYRPPNYHAEMVKSDGHMGNIKSCLLYDKKVMEETEERKKARANKKIAKQVQSQKMKERQKQKKDDIESVNKWRKRRQQSGFSDELDLEFGRGGGKKRPGVSPSDRSGGKGMSASRMKNKKREFRDSKFGHGGRKGLSKHNNCRDDE